MSSLNETIARFAAKTGSVLQEGQQRPLEASAGIHAGIGLEMARRRQSGDQSPILEKGPEPTPAVPPTIYMYG